MIIILSCLIIIPCIYGLYICVYLFVSYIINDLSHNEVILNPYLWILYLLICVIVLMILCHWKCSLHILRSALNHDTRLNTKEGMISVERFISLQLYWWISFIVWVQSWPTSISKEFQRSIIQSNAHVEGEIWT